MTAMSRIKRSLPVLAFLSPWIIGTLTFGIIPIVASIYFSFTSYSLGAPPIWIGLANWKAMLHDPLTWTALWNSLYFTFVSVPLQLILALIIAIMLNAKIPFRGGFRTLFYLPTLVPTVAASILWLSLLNPYSGLINQALGFLHLPQPLWLQSPTWAMPGLILMSLWGVGTTIVIYLAGLQDVPRQLYEQGMIDGAGGFKLFLHVTIPMISPVILFNAVISLIGAMQTFTQPYLMTQGGPLNSTFLYSMNIYQNAFEYLNMGFASSLAWFLFLIIMVLTLFALWISRNSVTYQ